MERVYVFHGFGTTKFEMSIPPGRRTSFQQDRRVPDPATSARRPVLQSAAKAASAAPRETSVELFALGLVEAPHVLQPDRTRPGAQEQRIGAGTLSRHDDLGLRFPVRRPAEEPEPLGEFVELEVGEDTDRVLLDLVGRFALSPRVALGPASCPRAVPERLVECSKVTFQDVPSFRTGGPPRGPGTRPFREGIQSATLERSVNRGNQRTDRPPLMYSNSTARGSAISGPSRIRGSACLRRRLKLLS
jgi:hypothetical protein